MTLESFPGKVAQVGGTDWHFMEWPCDVSASVFVTGKVLPKLRTHKPGVVKLWLSQQQKSLIMESWNPRVVLICTYVKSIHFKMKTMTNVDISSEPLTYSVFGKTWHKNPAKAQKTTWKSTRKGPEQPAGSNLQTMTSKKNQQQFPFYTILFYSYLQ